MNTKTIRIQNGNNSIVAEYNAESEGWTYQHPTSGNWMENPGQLLTGWSEQDEQDQESWELIVSELSNPEIFGWMDQAEDDSTIIVESSGNYSFSEGYTTLKLQTIFAGSDLALRIIEEQIGDRDGRAVWYPGDEESDRPATPESILSECGDALDAMGKDFDREELIQILSVCEREGLTIPSILLTMQETKVVFITDGPVLCDVVGWEERDRAEIYLLNSPYGQSLIVLEYQEENEQMQFTQYDWEQPVREIPENLNEIRWQRCRDGRAAVMMQGLPRVME